MEGDNVKMGIGQRYKRKREQTREDMMLKKGNCKGPKKTERVRNLHKLGSVCLVRTLVQRRPVPSRYHCTSWGPNTLQNIYSIPKFNNFLTFSSRPGIYDCQFSSSWAAITLLVLCASCVLSSEAQLASFVPMREGFFFFFREAI